ncbi:unnamed protein product, partial [Rotaria socialis]
PYVTSSPTSVDQNNENKYESNGLMLDSSNYQGVSTGESSLLLISYVLSLLLTRVYHFGKITSLSFVGAIKN